LEHIKEFSRYASSYDEYNIIQKEVASSLLSKIQNHPKRILDLGCGSGVLCKNFNQPFELFIGVDSSHEMCKLHPTANNIHIINANFDTEDFFLHVKRYAPFDLIISSSALQWAKNIENILEFCKKNANHIAFSIFTKGTFQSIYELSKIKSFLPSYEELLKTIEKYYKIDYEVKKYKLYFKDNISKFRYIKKSGVSGGKKQLNISETKALIKEYPHEYLEFEVLVVYSVGEN
jgi:malonyl-CoA O-methyltransferase